MNANDTAGTEDTMAPDAPPKYLVCIDGRPESDPALKLACIRARQHGAKLDLLHVVPPADFQTLLAVADRITTERRLEGKTLLKKQAEFAHEMGIEEVGMLLREGAVGDAIVSAVKEDPTLSLIILGVSESAGRGSLTAWLASQGGAKLPIPLLLVPGALTEEQLQKLA